MSLPAPIVLLEDLRRLADEVDRVSDEELAHELPMRLRTLARWKGAEIPEFYGKLMTMLRAAGWLNEERVAEAVRRAEMLGYATEALQIAETAAVRRRRRGSGK